MILTVDQGALARGLETVRSVVPQKSTLPILANILLRAEGSVLSLAVTDLDTTVVTRIEADVKEPGGVTVHARRFGDLVKDLSRDPVTLEVKNAIVHLTCAKTRARFPGTSVDEFPKLPEIAAGSDFEIDSARFRRAVKKTSFCVSRDETRPVLTGLLWRFTKSETIVVGTDGYRLARTGWKSVGIKASHDLLLSPRPLGHVAGLLRDDDQPVKVVFDDNHALFQFGGTDVYTRLIEGTFPKYEQVIPKESPKRVVVEREAIMTAVRRASHVSDTLSRQLQLSLSSGRMTVKAESAEEGEVRDEIAVEYDGESLDIGFNGAFLMEILKAMDGERVVFRLASPVTAGLVEPEGETDGESHLCLLMPLRLTEG
ncbi:MAG: DNA polymerase III subunit beta [bacterium]